LPTFDPVTRQAVSITDLFGLELAITAVLLAFVFGWLIVALVRFRATPGDAIEPPQTHGNRRLELIWTTVPVLTLAIIVVLMIQSMRSVDAAPSGGLAIRIIGHQWWWELVYPDGQSITANELHLPLDRSVDVSLESVDVIHSFHVPQFGWMRDLVPGKTNRMSFFVERAGVYDGTCNQYCGAQHAWMRARVVAEPTDAFNGWLQRQAQPASPSVGARGQQVFLQNTCVNCHTIRGVATQANVGPDLTHVGSRSTLGAGVVDNTVETMRQWLRNAGRIKPGVLMPPFQNLSEADLNDLADYLESLK
jgi:cytochrome c oxidase subunit 2